jgi:hypothetical protein
LIPTAPAPVAPSLAGVSASASAAHSAIAVNERSSQHRAHRQPQDHRQSVAHPPPVPWVSDPAQHRQQTRRVFSSLFGKVSKMANGRVNR